MTKSILAPQNVREYKSDIIFGANSLAQAAIAQYGKDNVISATIGAILDEEGNHVFFKSVEKVYRSLPAEEYSQYAPIAGLPDYLKAVEAQCFGKSRPNAHVKSVAVAGGTGGLHHLIHLYTELGDEVLTADWYWGAYASLCADQGRSLVTYQLLTDDMKFNHEGFQEAVKALAAKQKNILLFMNTPAHNPTGYTVSDDDWNKIITFLKEIGDQGHNIVIGIDVAYLDYAGDGDEVRKMFKKFEKLPSNILAVVVYSLSKGYTLYGQRLGAMIGISSDEDVINEFYHATEFTSRATWSNLCRPGMRTMIEISNNPELQAEYVAEREFYNELVNERAAIFMSEAEECGLKVLPYHGGFFISIPSTDSVALSAELNKKNIFLVPLKKGLRIAVCALPKAKIKGLAKVVKEAQETLGM